MIACRCDLCEGKALWGSLIYERENGNIGMRILSSYPTHQQVMRTSISEQWTNVGTFLVLQHVRYSESDFPPLTCTSGNEDFLRKTCRIQIQSRARAFATSSNIYVAIGKFNSSPHEWLSLAKRNLLNFSSISFENHVSCQSENKNLLFWAEQLLARRLRNLCYDQRLFIVFFSRF